jgi:NAD(P)-dependent dehydrogenase (short-subunit alcohol dehydrogenase family)
VEASVAALEGKVAVVAGASRGIGKGIALELGAAGATVYLTGRTVEPSKGSPGSLAETAAAIDASGGVSVPVRCDHSDDADVAALFVQISSEQGHLDVAVNCVFNSSAFRSTLGRSFWELPISVWHDVVDLGTRSAYVASAHAVPLMLGRGDGLIVNISARGAERYRYNVVYGVGKAALDRMTRDMADELRDRGVAVISLWPGTIRTEHMDAMFEAGDSWALENFPEPDQLETPRFVGRAVAALAGDPNVMARSGGRFWAAEIAADYGLADEYGRTHAVPE